MAVRYDDIGLFWEDRPAAKTRGSAVVNVSRSIPATPDTGWVPPTSFPDLSSASCISVDLETRDDDLFEKGPGPLRGSYIVGIAVGVPTGERWYFPIRHERGFNFDPEHVLAWARVNLCREGQPKVGANLMYDLEFLYREGVPVTGPFWDVQIAEPLLDENARSYSLERLGRTHLGEGKTDDLLYSWLASAFGGKATRREQAGRIWRAPSELVGPYAQGDVDLPLRILEKQRVLLEEQGLMPLFALESALIPMMLAMRLRGVRVDTERAGIVYEQLGERIDGYKRETKGIDVYSAADLASYCERNGIAHEKTAAGNPSFTQEWLESVTDPVLRAVNNERKATKIRDTFVKGYILDKEIGGRIYCQFHQLRSDDSGTVSGRFSSSLPNLQNIPARDEYYGPLLRSLFVPDHGEDWVALDWSQIEFRFLAHYGMGRGAEETREEYRTNPTVDFHAMVTQMLKWTADQRKYAKNINFGLVYGMGEPTMARRVGKPLDEVKPIFDEYHERLPFVRHTYNEVARVAANRGYIMTYLKRRRRFDLWEKRNSKNDTALDYATAVATWGENNIRRAFTHKSLNALLQGSAADLMKQAMVQIWESGVIDVLGAPLLTVHDELDWSKPRTTAAGEAMLEVKHIMETCGKLQVPIVADMKAGQDWSRCK